MTEPAGGSLGPSGDFAGAQELGKASVTDLEHLEKPATAEAQRRVGAVAVGGFDLPPLRFRDLATLHGWKRLCTEGHTVFDAALTVSMAQIGQVMLVWPYQMHLTGITAGIILMIISGIWNLYTMIILIWMYLVMKNSKIKAGTWFEDGGLRRTVTQFHEVVGFFGGPWVQGIGQLLCALSLFGTGIAQVIASAGNCYSILPTHSKRAYELYFGAALVAFSFVPTFRHFRILNVIGLIGTTFTEWYIFGAATNKGFSNTSQAQFSPVSMSGFFIGASTLANGGHSNALEMVDAMQESKKYDWAYTIGYIYSYFLTTPHSVAVNLAFSKEEITNNQNVYGLLPITTAKKVSVWLMIIHQFIAWSLYVTPLLYMWEKAIRTHKKPLWIRLPSRLPIAVLIWFVGVLFPFYSTVNSLFAAVTGPFIGFLIPCGLFNWHYRTKEARDASTLKPPGFLKKWEWKPMFIINILLTLVNLVMFTGFGIYYNIKSIIDNAKTFGVFPKCYQCG